MKKKKLLSSIYDSSILFLANTYLQHKLYSLSKFKQNRDLILGLDKGNSVEICIFSFQIHVNHSIIAVEVFFIIFFFSKRDKNAERRRHAISSAKRHFLVAFLRPPQPKRVSREYI